MTTHTRNIAISTEYNSVRKNVYFSDIYAYVPLREGDQSGFDTSQAISSEIFFEIVVFEM